VVNLLSGAGLSLALGGNEILRGVDAEIGAGEVVGLIGPNGAGKTTLVKLLSGLLKPDAGEVCWQTTPLGSIDDRERGRQIAYLAQGAPAYWPLQVEKIVQLGRIPHQAWWQSLGAEDAAAVEEAMLQAEVAHLRQRLVTTLSGGERTRVLLARIFATRPQLILADEPVASLDPYHQLHVMELLRQHANAGGAVLVVLHDLNLAARFCDRLLLLDEGRVRDCGAPAEVLGGDAVSSAYGLQVTLHHVDGELVLTYR
jgi:ABC-type cobalamin/Fe3+-siderophores transport system ATPase subunit